MGYNKGVQKWKDSNKKKTVKKQPLILNGLNCQAWFRIQLVTSQL